VRIHPTSAVDASYRVAKIKARVGMRKAICRPHSNAAEGTSRRFT
jgi:hypothetical protein